MSAVCYAIPIAADFLDQGAAVLRQWKQMGYAVAYFTNGERNAPLEGLEDAFHFHRMEWHGWGWACNEMAERLYPHFEWLVFGGHDITPDPHRQADVIASECKAHWQDSTYGVMQPCGDDWGAHKARIAVTSPWVGREWWQKTKRLGRGPFWEEYGHYYVDAELCEIAGAAKRLWWRPDLTQVHNHYARQGEPVPPHLVMH